MLKLFACILALVFVPCLAYGEAYDFAFMDAITWNTSADEAMEFLGEGAMRVDDKDDSIGSLTLLRAEGVEVFGYLATALTLVFYNSELEGIGIAYTDEAVSDVETLIGCVEKVYGHSERLREDVKTLFDFIYGSKTRARWKLGAETEIKVVDYTEVDGQYPYLVSIENLIVSERLNDTLNDSRNGLSIE